MHRGMAPGQWPSPRCLQSSAVGRRTSGTPLCHRTCRPPSAVREDSDVGVTRAVAPGRVLEIVHHGDLGKRYHSRWSCAWPRERRRVGSRVVACRAGVGRIHHLKAPAVAGHTHHDLVAGHAGLGDHGQGSHRLGDVNVAAQVVAIRASVLAVRMAEVLLPVEVIGHVRQCSLVPGLCWRWGSAVSTSRKPGRLWRWSYRRGERIARSAEKAR